MTHGLGRLVRRPTGTPSTRHVPAGTTWLIAIAATLLGITTTNAGTLRLADTEAVESGRDALNGRVSFPWYDASSEDLRPIVVRPHREVDARNRASNWENRWTLPNAPSLKWLWQVLYYVMIGLLFLVPVALAGLVVWAIINSDGAVLSPARVTPRDERVVGDIKRIENLPFELRVPHGDLLAEAKRLQEAGDYRKAIVYLFSHQLLFLDQHQLIRLAKGKTNRQYIREVRRRVPNVKQLVERTMIAFEDVFFGDHPLEQSRFDACWNDLDEFHQRVEEASA